LENYKKTLDFLFGLQIFGIKFGLENIKSLLDYLGNPESKYPTVHIAGTNGKGSTAAMIASILTESGYRTGLYTSPHLIDFTERIKINGNQIKRNEVVKYTRILKNEIIKTKATFFEATTAIAFQYFYEQNVDIAVIETGLGGRQDATNVITPEISVITSIGLEHTKYLGNSLGRIAAEKGGIIKKNIPCVISIKDKKALEVIKSISEKKCSHLFDVHKTTSVKVIQNDIYSLRINLKIGDLIFPNLKIGLTGSYQLNNIKSAINAIKLLKEKPFLKKINKKNIIKGLKNVKENTRLRGRLEILRGSPLMIGDVAHNPQAFESLSRALRDAGIEKTMTIFGIMKDKDVDSIFPYLTEFSRLIIACQPDIPRALQSRKIFERLQKLRFPCIDGKSVLNTIKIAKSISKNDDTIVICGSHHVLGESYDFLKN
jgi:dihydrofolate synthase / folylpolyglutamate synthase